MCLGSPWGGALRLQLPRRVWWAPHAPRRRCCLVLVHAALVGVRRRGAESLQRVRGGLLRKNRRARAFARQTRLQLRMRRGPPAGPGLCRPMHRERARAAQRSGGVAACGAHANRTRAARMLCLGGSRTLALALAWLLAALISSTTSQAAAHSADEPPSQAALASVTAASTSCKMPRRARENRAPSDATPLGGVADSGRRPGRCRGAALGQGKPQPAKALADPVRRPGRRTGASRAAPTPCAPLAAQAAPLAAPIPARSVPAHHPWCILGRACARHGVLPRARRDGAPRRAAVPAAAPSAARWRKRRRAACGRGIYLAGSSAHVAGRGGARRRSLAAHRHGLDGRQAHGDGESSHSVWTGTECEVGPPAL